MNKGLPAADRRHVSSQPPEGDLVFFYKHSFTGWRLHCFWFLLCFLYPFVFPPQCPCTTISIMISSGSWPHFLFSLIQAGLCHHVLGFILHLGNKQLAKQRQRQSPVTNSPQMMKTIKWSKAPTCMRSEEMFSCKSFSIWQEHLTTRNKKGNIPFFLPSTLLNLQTPSLRQIQKGVFWSLSPGWWAAIASVFVHVYTCAA